MEFRRRGPEHPEDGEERQDAVGGWADVPYPPEPQDSSDPEEALLRGTEEAQVVESEGSGEDFRSPFPEDEWIEQLEEMAEAAEFAEAIANGHAFDKHVVEGGEFPEIRSRSEFASHIQDVIEHGSSRDLRHDRKAWFHELSRTIVVYDPNSADSGTAFRRWEDPWDYFKNVLK
jgi:hypothetical protein